MASSGQRFLREAAVHFVANVQTRDAPRLAENRAAGGGVDKRPPHWCDILIDVRELFFHF